MMTSQTEPLKTSEAIHKVMIANLIIMLIFMFAPYTELLTVTSNFLQIKIANSCSVGAWISPRHALSISASMAFSVSIAIFFSLFGAYSKEEMKRERNGGSVILGMTLIAAFLFYFVVFYLPCGASSYHGTTTGKARLGEAMIYFLTNYKLLFILFVSGFSGLLFYCTALALKLIKDGK